MKLASSRSVSIGNYLSRCCSRSLTWYCYWYRSCFWSYFRRSSAYLYNRSICAALGDWNPLSIVQLPDFPPSRNTCCSHLEGQLRKVRAPDAYTAVSAGSAAVLLIFILIFNFGASFETYLHKEINIRLRSYR